MNEIVAVTYEIASGQCFAVPPTPAHTPAINVLVYGVSGTAGTQVDLAVAVQGQGYGAKDVSGLNLDLVYPTDVITALQCTLDFTVAQQNHWTLFHHSCALPTPSGAAQACYRLLAFDQFDQNSAQPIADGIMATCRAQILSTVAPDTYPLEVRRLAVSDPTGNELPSSANADGITVLAEAPPCLSCCTFCSDQRSASNLLFMGPAFVLWAWRRRRTTAARRFRWFVVALSVVAAPEMVRAQAAATSGHGSPISLRSVQSFAAATSASPVPDGQPSWFVRNLRLDGDSVRGELALLQATFMTIGEFQAGLPGADLLVQGVLTDTNGQTLGTVSAMVTPIGLDGEVIGADGTLGEWSWVSPNPESWAALYDTLAAQPTSTPTPADIPTAIETPTPADTATPTASPTPLPCTLLSFAPISSAYIGVSGAAYPPGTPSCLLDPTEIVVARTHNDTGFAVSNALLRWDTSTLPADQVITEAALELEISGVDASDPQTFAADWLAWDGTCSAGFVDNPPNDAFAGCGDVCQSSDFALLSPGAGLTVELDDAVEHIVPDGGTSVRLHVSGDQPSGSNELRFVGSGHPDTAPRLIVKVCDPSFFTPTPTATETPTPVPTATPPAGCEYHVLTTTNGWTAVSLGQEDPLPFLECQEADGGASILAVRLIDADAGYAAEGKILLRWSTTSLPQNLRVQRAWLGLCVWQVGNNNDRQLIGDWYNWGESCDAEDATTPWGETALSVAGVCGDQCNLATIPSLQCTNFELENPPAHFDSDAVSLRLGISGALASGMDVVYAALAVDSYEPALVVLMCEPTATETPAETATDTPTPAEQDSPTETPTP